MLELFQTGGMLFMSILTIQLAIVLLLSGRYAVKTTRRTADLDLIRGIGLLAAVTGILAQLIGLFSAFRAIEIAGSVSPGMLAAGLKVSSITSIYGLLVFATALIMWSIFRARIASEV